MKLKSAGSELWRHQRTKLQNEANGHLDTLRAITASQMRITETVNGFYGDGGTPGGVGGSLKQAVEELNEETIKALDGSYKTTVLESISMFCAYFPDIKECLRLPQHHSFQSIPNRNLAKIRESCLENTEKKVQMARAIYEAQNNQLTTDLPKMIDIRVSTSPLTAHQTYMIEVMATSNPTELTLGLEKAAFRPRSIVPSSNPQWQIKTLRA
ncbi:hypothetical protein HOY80DRAFT_1055102 [Tuber brumale]|nr:hypothetical protein HOY80DRAFT_1055102 [Tuber brumale]